MAICTTVLGRFLYFDRNAGKVWNQHQILYTLQSFYYATSYNTLLVITRPGLGSQMVIIPTTSKKLTRHIGFGFSVSAPVRQELCMLGFEYHIWIPHGKIFDTHFFFLVWVNSLSGVMPLWMKSDACHILWAVHARILKFHIWIPHGKIADPYFFSCLSYLPFWSYAPLKKSEWNLVNTISWKVFELGAWNLVSW